ncbi:MAG TPA: hypothetical protein VF222_03890 [Nitrososphaeraceae archaeon]
MSITIHKPLSPSIVNLLHKTNDIVFYSTISFINIKFLIIKAKYYVIEPHSMDGSTLEAGSFLGPTCYRGAYNKKPNI